MDSESRATHFRCLTGHAIDAAELDRATEVVKLDQGAEVRICREHGAPVAQSIPPVPERDPE